MTIKEDDKLQISPEKEFTFVDSIKVLLKYKRLIILVCLTIGIITAILVYFVLDPIFQSTSTIKVTPKSVGLGALASGGLNDLGGLGELGGGSSSKELALYENILLSRRCIEETILRFKLLEEWDVKYMQDAVNSFRDNVMEIKRDRLAGTIDLGVYDKNKERSKEICEFLIYQLNKINTELNVQNAKNNREFIEARYNLVKEDLESAEDSLKNFQDLFGVAPDIQVRAVAQSEMQLEGEIRSEEIKLELLGKILTPEQAEIQEQQEKIAALKRQLDELQNSTDRSSKLHLKGTPDIVMNYFRLTRNVEIQNKILTYILPIFEQAKIEEKKETPSILVLDPPNVPEKKVKPKRFTNVLISMVSSFIILAIILLLYETFFKKIRHSLKEAK